MACRENCIKITGPLSFEIELSGGRVVCWHQDHICKRLASSGTLDANSFDDFTDTLDVDSTNIPNRNLPEATAIVPRRNPPRDCHPHLVTLPIITPDDTFKWGRV